MSRKIIGLTLAAALLCALFANLPAPMVGAEPAPSQVVLERVAITAQIQSGYAVTEITNFYSNPTNDSQQVHFQMQIPAEAFISNMSLTVDNRTIYASVLPKDQADKEYNDSVSSGQTASIAKTSDSERFSFSINLKGYANLSLTLRYEQFLTKFLGERTYELYLDTMDLAGADFQLELNIRSLTGLTSLDIYDHSGHLDEVWSGVKQVTLSLSDGPYVDRGSLKLEYGDEPLPTEGGLLGYYDTGTRDYYFLNLFAPQKDDLGGEISKDIVFVLDKSGSMGIDNMDQMKDAFKAIIDQLPATDRFNIIMFDNKVRVYQQELLQADEQNKTDAKDYLKGITSGGSTNIYDSLEEALEMLTTTESRAPIVVMLTDGQANSGKYETPHLIRTNIQTKNEDDSLLAPIFTLGFGTGADDVFLAALSMENNARYTFIDPDGSVTEDIGDFYDTISSTLLKDLTFEYPDAAFDIFPTQVPALYEGSEVYVVGKLDLENHSGELTTFIEARSYNGTRQLENSYPVNTTFVDDEFIKRLWTYAKIKELGSSLVLESKDEQDATKALITELALDAHFVTPYTSLFLSVEDLEDTQEEPDEKPGDDGQYPSGYVPPGINDPGRGYQDDNNDRVPSGDDDEAVGASPSLGPLLIILVILGVAVLFRRVAIRTIRSEDKETS